MEISTTPTQTKVKPVLLNFRENSSKLGKKLQKNTGLKAKIDRKLTETVLWRKMRRQKLWKYQTLADKAADFPVLPFFKEKSLLPPAPLVELLAELPGNFSKSQELAEAICKTTSEPCSAAQALVGNRHLEISTVSAQALVVKFLKAKATMEDLAVFEKLFPSATEISGESLHAKLNSLMRREISRSAVISSSPAVAMIAGMVDSVTVPQWYLQRLSESFDNVGSGIQCEQLAERLVAAELLGFTGTARIVKDYRLPTSVLERVRANFKLKIAKAKSVVVYECVELKVEH
jgi:hypothetical protein